jgi:hypothetical protein
MYLKRLEKIGFCFSLILLLSVSCAAPKQSPIAQTRKQGSVPRKDINDVLRQHDQELMAIPGVVGVAVGLMLDDKTLCLKVLVVSKTESLEKKIPKSIDGYPVVIEESGEIRPLEDKGR